MKAATTAMRLLFILPGLVPPASDPLRTRFHYLSAIAEGEVLLPVWWRSLDQVRADLKKAFPVHRVGNFSYHMFLFVRFPRVFRKLALFAWYLWRGLALHRQRKIDVIVSYGTNTPGLAGTLLKWLTNAKLIVEIPGVPENAFRYDKPNPGFRSALKHFFADVILLFVGTASDCLELFYPWQVRRYPRLQKKPKAIVFDFAALRYVEFTGEQHPPFILCAGYPWYTKGMDILVRAFMKIAAKYPDVELKLMGHLPDRQALENLAGECPQIKFMGARPNEEALKVIASCTVYVSASRTEGLPRVVLEAMAGGRAVIASDVGGVAHCIRDGENGLLFSTENVEELAEKISQLLDDPQLRERLGRRARERVMSEFDEFAYVRRFQDMLELVVLEREAT